MQSLIDHSSIMDPMSSRSGRHRLTDINKPNVVFVGYSGTVWRTPENGNPRQAIGGERRASINQGEFWEEES